MKKPLIVFGLIGAVILIAVLKTTVGNDDTKSVVVQTLQNQIIEASILASGTITHEEEVLLTSEEIGRVTEVTVEEGDKVTKGQLLLKIDDEDRVRSVEQSEAAVRMQKIAIERNQLRVENLRNQLQRKQALYERQLLDEDSFERATNDLELAEVDLKSSREALIQQQAQLEQQRNRLSKTRVYSPIDGVITSLDIKEGETAITSTTNIAGSALMTIANPASIQTEVYVDESDVANVAVGQKAEVVAIAYQDTPVEGSVSSIAISAKQEQGKQGLSFAVKIQLKPTDDVELRPGMSCRAEIFTHGQQEVPAVPIQAILVEEDRTRNLTSYHVFVNRNGSAEKVAVEVGISDDEYQEIKTGLQLGDEIVIGPDSVLRHLNDGDELDARLDDLPG